MKKFKNWTKQQKMVAWLESRGYRIIPSPTRKAVCLSKAFSWGTNNYFISKVGTVRTVAGDKPVFGDSWSVKLDETKLGAFCSRMEALDAR